MAQTSGVEPAVKATYLYKFAPFVDWPPGTFESPSDPLVLGIAGADAVANLIDDAISGQRLGTRTITVRHVSLPAGDARCHLLYVALVREDAAAAALESVRGTP